MKLIPMLFLLAAGWAGPLSGDAPAAGFDHSHHQWDALLKRYVVGSTVRYRVWARDRGGLDAYVRSLARVTGEQFEQFTEPQKLAFWINAYNAFTIQVVLDHYPIRPHLLSLSPANSIRQISGVWDDFYLEAGGGRYSLNQIEHEILRAEFGEPRIHVAINCASVGCPPLRQEAFQASRIEAQLADQAERFARLPLHVRLDRGKKILYVSKIFSWFGGDFIGNYSWEGPGRLDAGERAVLAFLHRHLPPEERSFLESTPVKIRYLDYDWHLNETEEE